MRVGGSSVVENVGRTEGELNEAKAEAKRRSVSKARRDPKQQTGAYLEERDHFDGMLIFWIP